MNVDFYCSLWGKEFDPTSFLNDDQLEIGAYHRIGDLGTKGSSKGRILESGHIRFKSKEGNFDDFVKKLHSMKDLVVENNAERRVLHIVLWYKGQGNWEFAPNVLKMIGELNLTLTLSFAKMDDEMSNNE